MTKALRGEHVFRAEAIIPRPLVTDEVRYRLPFYPFAEVGYPLVCLQIKRIFAYRIAGYANFSHNRRRVRRADRVESIFSR